MVHRTSGQTRRETIARLRATAAGAVTGYSLVRWAGIVPEERIDQVAVLHEVLNDSPRDATVEPTELDGRNASAAG